MRKLLLASLAIVSIGVGASIAANYTVTQGSGTNFGSIVVGGINYAQQFICDLTTPAQCAKVDSSGTQYFDTQASGNLLTAINSPPPLNVNTVNTSWTGLNPAVAQTGTIIAANVDVSSIKGTTTLTGNGVTGAGSQRVTIASDNTAFSVNAAQATASNLNAQVSGDTASGASDAGNPVKIGGVFITTPTAITTGQRGSVQLDANSNLRVVPAASTNNGADGVANSSVYQTLSRTTGTSATVLGTSISYLYNGTTWDRPRSVAGDAQAATGIAAVGSMVWNGATYDRLTPTMLSTITTWGGGTLGAMANYGTSPGAVLVPGVNAFITNATPGIANNADAIATVAASSTSPVPVNNYGYVFNGTTYDRMRSGTQIGSVAVASSDPCLGANKTNLAISQSGTSSVQLIALSGSTVIYVCSISLIAAGATTAVITTGTGSACVTGNAAVIGDTTANIANGLSFAANSGLTLGNGAGTIAKGAASSELCMTLGTNVRMSGNLTYVQQ